MLSLVGKDQETITKAIKELAENSEKVKLQETQIKELDDKNDEFKEEVHYLWNKLDLKRDIIEDLENEMERKVVEMNELRNDLDSKEKGLDLLEKFIKDRVEEINTLRDNNQSMVSQISENIMMERKINIQNEVQR